jgi:hypothetical protein
MATNDLVPASRSERSCRVTKWEPWPFENSSLIGHATCSFSGWVIPKIPAFRRADGSLSVGTPSVPEIDAEGRIRMRDGKKQYHPAITFETAEAKERWERAILSALSAAGIGGVS